MFTCETCPWCECDGGLTCDASKNLRGVVVVAVVVVGGEEGG